MKRLSTLAFRNLWARKARTVLTALGIILGVGTVFALSISNASTAKSLEDFFAQSSGRASLTISSASDSTVGFRQRTLREVQNFPGVQTAVANTEDQSLLLGRDGQVSLKVVGIDPEADRLLRSYEIEQGRFLSSDDRRYTAVLVSSLAEKYDVQVGDDVELVVAEGTEMFEVVGLISDEGAGRTNLGRVAFVPLDVAQRVFDRGRRVDRIDLVAEPAVANDAEALARLKDDLQAQLGAAFVVDYPGAVGQSVAGALESFNAAMGVFGFVALLVGALLIYNTFAMTVIERTREIGLLRALGVRKRQLLGLVLNEALFLGVGGSMLGLAAGPLLGIALIKMMAPGMGGLPLDSFVVPVSGAVRGMAVGLVVTLIAALLPALRASRISPIEALRAEVVRRESWLTRRGWMIGLPLLGTIVADQFLHFITGGELFFVILFLGATLLVPTTVGLLERVIRRGMEAVYGLPGRLGSMNLQRAKGRVSLTAGVLMIGVVMLIAIGSINTSFRAEMHDWVEAALAGDLYISSFRPLRRQVMRNLRQVEGMGAMTPIRYLYVRTVGGVRGGELEEKREILLFEFIDPKTYGDVAVLRFARDEQDAEAMWARFAQGDAVLIGGVVSTLLNVERGDFVRLRTSRGEHDFEVAGIVQEFLQGGRVLYGTWDDMRRYFDEDKATFVLAKVEPGVPVSEVKQRLEEGIGRSRHLEVESGEEARRKIEGLMNQFLSLFSAVVWIAVVVAALGVTNTVTMSVLERTREIGMLRSLGMLVGQVGRMVLAESLAIGVIGGLFGLAVGLPMSWMMIEGMSQGTGWSMKYIFPTGSFVAGAIIAVVVSQLAALYPVWRASRVGVVQAISEREE